MESNSTVKLNAQEIEYLKAYTLERGISYSDVQLELVDHLASAIEDKKSENPSIEFKNALHMIMLDFPHTGFYHFENEAKKSLKEYWETKFKSYIYQYFKLPKILILIGLTFIFYMLFKVGGSTARNIAFFSMVGLWGIYGIKEIFWGMNSRYNRRSFLFIRKYYEACSGAFFAIGIAPFYLANLTTFGEALSQFACLIYAFSISLDFLVLYAIWFVFPDFLIKDIKTKYNHLNIKIA